MNRFDLTDLVERWEQAKADEIAATAERAGIECLILEHFEVAPDFEGTLSLEIPGVTIKTTYKLNRRVDNTEARRIATENGLNDIFGELFREKLEIAAKGWKKHGKRAAPLLRAVTATPAKPAIRIEREN